MNKNGALLGRESLIGILTPNGTLSGRLSGKKSLSGRLTRSGVLSGIISPTGTLSGRIKGENTLTGQLSLTTTAPTYKTYDGDYIVTPKAYEEQVLETDKKLMKDDVTVLEIPISIVGNLGGGATAHIG